MSNLVQVINMLQSNAFHSIVDTPIEVTIASSTLLDHILTLIKRNVEQLVHTMPAWKARFYKIYFKSLSFTLFEPNATTAIKLSPGILNPRLNRLVKIE